MDRLTLNAKRLTLLLRTFIVHRLSFIVIFFLTLFSLSTLTLTLLVSPVHAASVCSTSKVAQETRNQFNKVAIKENAYDSSVFNTDQIVSTADSLNIMLTGCSRIHPETNSATAGQGALAASGMLVASLYNAPPASGVHYFAQQIQKFNPVQPAYAQEGIGFKALGPTQKLWTAFRNISYVGFVIIFVIIGFMVMFRAHISPQAVATVQDSLPRLVIALILVTFSYAIAGLMIDAMFLAINIAINVIPLNDPDKAQNIFKLSFMRIVLDSWTDNVGGVGTAIANIIDHVVNLDFISKAFGLFGGSLAGLVVGIAMLFVIFRIFFMLLMAYVMIIVLTIAAPFFFLFQALPGRNGAGVWFKQMAANIATFPAVAIMLLLAASLTGIKVLGGDTSPLAGQTADFPLLTGGFDTKDIGRILGFGFFVMTPGAAQMVKEWLGVKGGGAFGGAAAGAAIGGALGAGATTLGKPLGIPLAPAKYAFQTRGIEGLKGMIPGRKPPETVPTSTPEQTRPSQPGSRR